MEKISEEWVKKMAEKEDSGITSVGGLVQKLTVKSYVVGFAFSSNQDLLLLIRKKRPEWQEGKLNGVGGKIEGDEEPLNAMVREFEEESGLATELNQWRYMGSITDKGTWTVHFFTTRLNVWSARTMTDEDLEVIQVRDLDQYDVIPNLRYLVPMALADYLEPFQLVEK